MAARRNKAPAKKAPAKKRGRPKSTRSDAERRSGRANAKRGRKLLEEIQARPKVQPKKRGAKALQWTQDDRDQVELLAGMGMTIDEICILTKNPKTKKPVDEGTLRKHFAEELQRGFPKMKAKVVQSMYRKAMSGDHPQAATLGIWISKAKFGWRSSEHVQVDVESKAGVLVAPQAISLEDWVAAQAAANAAKKSPEEEDGE